jgi:hypothetical protein
MRRKRSRNRNGNGREMKKDRIDQRIGETKERC